MYNELTIIGKVINDPTTKKLHDKEYKYIKVAVCRDFKNEYGLYEHDVFNCRLPIYFDGSINQGDSVLIKARLENETTIIDGNEYYYNEIVIKKCTYIGGNKNE